LRSSLAAVPGVLSGGAVYGGVEGFWVDQKHIAELGEDGSVQVRLTKALIREHRERLDADPRVSRRKTSDWVTVDVRSDADVALVVELVRLAAPLYMPPDGVPLRPPPDGAALERRRRFH